MSFDPFSPSIGQKNLKTRLDNTIDKKRLFSAIDSDPALTGAGVVYIDANFNAITLRNFEPICRLKPIKIIIREPQEQLADNEFITVAKDQRDSKLLMEAVSTGLACVGMVISIAAVFTSIGAVPFTGGSSMTLTVLSYSAAGATALQCGNGLIRTTLEAVDPKTLDGFDSNEWYTTAMSALDVISLAGATASGAQMIKFVKVLNSEGQSLKSVLKNLNRSERKRLSEEIIRQNRPGISNKMLKLLQRQGVYPKRYSIDNLRQSTMSQIYDSLSALIAFSGSASGGVIRQLAISSDNKKPEQLSVHIYEEF